MNREQLREGILDLADSPHMRQFALEHALDILTSDELGRLFDQVADHHSVLHPPARRRVPRNPRLGDQLIIDKPALAAAAREGLRLCVHADDDATLPHWLAEGQRCEKR